MKIVHGGAKIGVVWPGRVNPDDIQELEHFVPPDVDLRVVGTPAEPGPPGDITLELVISIAESSHIQEAASQLMRDGVTAIGYACTSASYVRGVGGDREIAARMTAAAGVPATTTSSATVHALRELDVRQVAVLSPHVDALNERLRAFLEASGFRVVRMTGLGMLGGIEEVPPESVRQLAEEADSPEADGLFISCTGMRTASIVKALESELRKAVVTASQATMWEVLRLAGVHDVLPGLGRLYRSQARFARLMA